MGPSSNQTVTAAQIAEGLHYFGHKEYEKLLPFFHEMHDSRDVPTQIMRTCETEFYTFVQAVVFTIGLGYFQLDESKNIKIRDSYLAHCKKIFSINASSDDETVFWCENSKLRIAFYQKALFARDPRSERIDNESNLRRALCWLIFSIIETNDPGAADEMIYDYLAGKRILGLDIPDIYALELIRILVADIFQYANTVAKMKLIFKE